MRLSIQFKHAAIAIAKPFYLYSITSFQLQQYKCPKFQLETVHGVISVMGDWRARSTALAPLFLQDGTRWPQNVKKKRINRISFNRFSVK
jgi:hypothetical protein